ncbi:proteasome activator [Pseudonocardia sp. GCM10023141]|uniref:proteasome activator n=1 Tax=Pseudonocardia sp. GCM10023141 TaxID=3252653 RepID=UPI00360D7B4A
MTTDTPIEIADPPKLLRLGSMIKQTLDEIHAMPLDDRGRLRLAGLYDRAVSELESALPASLRTEFMAIAPSLHTGAAVSDAELRIAQAQLVGWLEGLFQGVQFARAIHEGSLRPPIAP